MKKGMLISMLGTMGEAFARYAKADQYNYCAAHVTTRTKVRGPNAPKGKRHASLKSRSNRRK